MPEHSMSPFEQLARIAQRSTANARGLPAQKKHKSQWTGIGFKLGGLGYVVSMGEVNEILNVPRYTMVPGVQHWVKGLSNVRGRLLPILDLDDFFDKPVEGKSKRRRLLVLDDGELYTGVIVDEVLGLQHFQTDTLIDKLPRQYDEMKPYLDGGYQVGEGESEDVVAVFSIESLKQDARFLEAAS